MSSNVAMTITKNQSDPRIIIPSRKIEKGIAHDFGWEKIGPENNLSPISGLEDVLAIEKDVSGLIRAKNLKLNDKDLLPCVFPIAKKLKIGVKWHMHIAKLLTAVLSMVRLSEPVQAIYELAWEKSYWGRDGSLLPAADFWHNRSSESIQQALFFLHELKARYISQAYQDVLRYRENQAAYNLKKHLRLLDYLLMKYGCFHAIAMDFYLNKGLFSQGIKPIIQCRRNFFDTLLFSKFFGEDGYDYAWHLSYNIALGYYIRVLSFIPQSGFGAYEKYYSRFSRIWLEATNGIGICRDCRYHPNEFANVSSVVNINDQVSIKKIKRFFVYQVEKDKRLRVIMPERLRVFGHSEMADLDTSRFNHKFPMAFHSPSEMTSAKTLHFDRLNTGGYKNVI